MGSVGPLARGWRSALGVGALTGFLLLWAGLAFAQDAAPREVKLEIRSTADWTPTGIELGPGDALTIDAEPAAFPGGGTVSADGFHGFDNERHTTGNFDGLPAPDLPLAALIGRVGAGPIFQVGAHYQAKASEPGPLNLRWNLNLRWKPTPEMVGGEGMFFRVAIRHEPAAPVPDPDPDPDDDSGNESTVNTASTDGNVIVEDRPAPPRKGKATIPRPVASGKRSSGTPWLLPGLATLLLAAGAGGLSLQRMSRARTVKRTRALLALSPSLDLGEGACRGGSLPAEGPAASLRARLEEGAARCVEGGEDG
jgi:hypothetical protein